MKRVIVYIWLIFQGVMTYSQSEITGKVINTQGIAVPDVFISSSTPSFQITDTEGEFRLICPADSAYVYAFFSCMGYKDRTLKLYQGEEEIQVIMQDSISTLKEVIIQSARYGKFSNYAAQTTELTAFEVYTNPNALGDIIAGVKVMPGVQTHENDGRLVIQGGATDESQIYVDGLVFFNPYSLSQKNVSVRSRFSPDLFSGVALSSAGYGSAYGNALSGVLQLTTHSSREMPEKLDLTINSTGIGSSVIKKKNRTTHRGEVSYTNMTPYGKVTKDDYHWDRYYNQLSLDYFMVHNMGRRSALKTHFYYNHASVNYSYQNIDEVTFTNDLQENNFYGSVTGDFYLNSHWSLYTGINLSVGGFKGTDVSLKGDRVNDSRRNNHAKAAVSYSKRNFVHTVGVENIRTHFDERYSLNGEYQLEYKNNLTAVYDEVSILAGKLNLNLGVRGEYASYLKKMNVSPRSYIGYKFNPNHVLSFSWGKYYQLPSEDYLKFTPDLGYRNSMTSTLSYSFTKANSKLQADLYYKKYHNLITYTHDNFYYTEIGNGGNGKAKGINLFWKSSIGNLEYWLSYAYVDSDILAGSYLHKKTPAYVSNQVWNMTGKYWIRSLRSMLGGSFYIDSGAQFYNTYGDPASRRESPERYKLDLSWSFLPRKGVILHFSCQNVTGRKNVYGYEYSADGARSAAITPPGGRFFYIGAFITFSKLHINQLKSL